MSMIVGDFYVREVFVVPIHNVSFDDMTIVYRQWSDHSSVDVEIGREDLEGDWRHWGFSSLMITVLETFLETKNLNRLVFIPGDK